MCHYIQNFRIKAKKAEAKQRAKAEKAVRAEERLKARKELLSSLTEEQQAALRAEEKVRLTYCSLNLKCTVVAGRVYSGYPEPLAQQGCFSDTILARICIQARLKEKNEGKNALKERMARVSNHAWCIAPPAWSMNTGMCPCALHTANWVSTIRNVDTRRTTGQASLSQEFRCFLRRPMPGHYQHLACLGLDPPLLCYGMWRMTHACAVTQRGPACDH